MSQPLVFLRPCSAPLSAAYSLAAGSSANGGARAGATAQSGVHLNNAGMVLVAPYVPRLFALLQLTAEGKFISLSAAERAVYLLQYMVTGKSHAAEYELVLNKLMCGIGTSTPIAAGIELSSEERDTINQLLLSIIQHWSTLGRTSVEGLRETFLQRQAWLRLEEEAWQLEVKASTFDMLLDHLPWSYSLVKFGWMDKPLYVSWRNKS